MRGQRCDMVSGYLKLCSQKDVPPGLKCWSSPGKRCRHLQHQREDGAIQLPDGAAVSADLCPPARGSFSALVTQWAGVTRPSALGKGEKVVLREHACMNTEDAGDRSAVSQAAQSSALPPAGPHAALQTARRLGVKALGLSSRPLSSSKGTAGRATWVHQAWQPEPPLRGLNVKQLVTFLIATSGLV